LEHSATAPTALTPLARGSTVECFKPEGNDMNVARLLVSTAFLLVIANSKVLAAEPAGTTPAKSSAAGSDITPTEAPAQSPWGWLKTPSFTMPKLSFPKMPSDPLAPVKTSAHKVSDGAKKAWEGTKEMFTFGGSKTADAPAARTASAQEAPSLWQRMFGPKQEQKQGPTSVAEWMQQPRPE
jgi:hypothetical protein